MNKRWIPRKKCNYLNFHFTIRILIENKHLTTP